MTTRLNAVTLVAALLVGSSISGCASTSQRSLGDEVDANVVQYFPPEGRRWTYEAENEVIIALDRLDSARDHVEEIETQIEDMDDVFTKIDERSGKGRSVADARLSWLDVRRDEAYSLVAAAEVNVYCARARLELTKAQLAVRFDLPVEEDFIEPFEEQHQDCEEELAEARADAEQLFQETLKAKEAWRNARAQYAQKTGDYNHGMWID